MSVRRTGKKIKETILKKKILKKTIKDHWDLGIPENSIFRSPWVIAAAVFFVAYNVLIFKLNS